MRNVLGQIIKGLVLSFLVAYIRAIAIRISLHFGRYLLNGRVLLCVNRDTANNSAMIA